MRPIEAINFAFWFAVGCWWLHLGWVTAAVAYLAIATYSLVGMLRRMT